jgi:hypothetical protein
VGSQIFKCGDLRNKTTGSCQPYHPPQHLAQNHPKQRGCLVQILVPSIPAYAESNTNPNHRPLPLVPVSGSRTLLSRSDRETTLRPETPRGEGGGIGSPVAIVVGRGPPPLPLPPAPLVAGPPVLARLQGGRGRGGRALLPAAAAVAVAPAAVAPRGGGARVRGGPRAVGVGRGGGGRGPRHGSQRRRRSWGVTRRGETGNGSICLVGRPPRALHCNFWAGPGRVQEKEAEDGVCLAD